MTVILGIETSCDETAAAVVEDGRFIRSNVVFSQEDLHQRFGGVVPELASRQHLLGIVPAIENALQQAGTTWRELDGVAVSYGPGLAGSLLVGVNAAKAIALARRLPLVGVNHLEGHIYANWLIKPAPGWSLPSGSSDRRDADPGSVARKAEAQLGVGVLGAPQGPRPPDAPHEPGEPPFPLLCLIVSGGHSELVLMQDHGTYRLLGRTRDDAAGEAFDKVARILGLGYPGGPAIQRAAGRAAGDGAPAYRLTRPWLRGTYDFSFSGLKTAMLHLAQGAASGSGEAIGRPGGGAPLSGVGGLADEPRGTDEAALEVAQMAAAFQEAVVDVLVGKTCQAAEDVGARQIALAGGVAANARLRQEMAARSPLPVFVPDIDLCTDNAAMIAAAGYYRYRAGHVANWDLDVLPNLRLA